MTDLTFTIHAQDIDAKTYAEILELRKNLRSLEVGLLNSLHDHPRYKAAVDLMKKSEYGRKIDPIVKFSNNLFTIQVTMDRPATKPAYTPKSQYVDPKVANNLINSKLLSDAEKRALIRSMLPDGVLAGVEDGEA